MRFFYFVLLSVSFAVARAQWTYVSAKTVSDVGASTNKLSQVSPAFTSCDTGNSLGQCQFYLTSGSCMGPFGPIGAYGPLASLGPLQQSYIGTVSDYASFLNNQITSWYSNQNSAAMTTPTDGSASDYFGNVATGQGALSSSGPLGANGPLGSSYSNVMPSINAFAAQLAAQGLFTVLGPLGPLGALGPLGPVGPISLVSLGYGRDSNGNYNQGGSVVRTINVPFGSGTRAYELFEWYDATFASSMSNNDASFMVRGDLSISSSQSFPFTSNSQQYVTIVVVPEAQLDDYVLELVDATSGSVVVRSTCDASSNFINWIQILAPQGQPFRARVRLASSMSPIFSHPFRLFVVGSTSNFQSSPVSGPHIQSWTPGNSNSFTKKNDDESGIISDSSSSSSSPLLVGTVAAMSVAAALLVAAAVVVILRRRRVGRNYVDLEMYRRETSPISVA